MVEIHHHFDSVHGLDSEEQHYEFHLTSCVIKINNQNRLYDEGKDKRTWLRGKDCNAKAKIPRNTGKIGQHNGYTGMENETTLKRLDKTSSRNSKHETLDI